MLSPSLLKFSAQVSCARPPRQFRVHTSAGRRGESAAAAAATAQSANRILQPADARAALAGSSAVQLITDRHAVRATRRRYRTQDTACSFSSVRRRGRRPPWLRRVVFEWVTTGVGRTAAANPPVSLVLHFSFRYFPIMQTPGARRGASRRVILHPQGLPWLPARLHTACQLASVLCLRCAQLVSRRRHFFFSPLLYCLFRTLSFDLWYFDPCRHLW